MKGAPLAGISVAGKVLAPKLKSGAGAACVTPCGDSAPIAALLSDEAAPLTIAPTNAPAIWRTSNPPPRAALANCPATASPSDWTEASMTEAASPALRTPSAFSPPMRSRTPSTMSGTLELPTTRTYSRSKASATCAATRCADAIARSNPARITESTSATSLRIAATPRAAPSLTALAARPSASRSCAAPASISGHSATRTAAPSASPATTAATGAATAPSASANSPTTATTGPIAAASAPAATMNTRTPLGACASAAITSRRPAMKGASCAPAVAPKLSIRSRQSAASPAICPSSVAAALAACPP